LRLSCIDHSGREVGVQTHSCGSLEIDESDVKYLSRLAEDLKEKLLSSVILYSGVESVPLSPKTVAMPLPAFF
jgi:hypothetical protein